MLINDLIALLMEIPPVLAGRWGAWFVVGLVLSIWQRREKAPSRRAWPRADAHVRRRARRPACAPPRLVAPSTPPSSGDAFGDLEALLESQAGTHRPGRGTARAAACIERRRLRNAPALAAPQSLP